MITRARLYGLTHMDASLIPPNKKINVTDDVLALFKNHGIKIDLSDKMHQQDCQVIPGK